MAFSLIASAKGVATSGAIDTTGADLIVVVVSSFDGSTTLSDNKSNTWTGLTASNNIDSYCRLYYCQAPTVGSGHTFTVSQSYAAVFAAAFSGSMASPFDQEAGTTGLTATTITPGSVTPSVDDELVISGLNLGGNSASPSVDSGFTLAQSLNGVLSVSYGGAIAYKIQTTAAAVNPVWTWTTAADCSARNATFKAATTATTTPNLIGGNLIRPNLVRGRLAA